MGVADWRSWTDQNGGTLPSLPNPPGTPWQINQMFPGVGPIGIGATPGPPGSSDLIDGQQSFPHYANTPITVNAIDPFYIGTWPTGQGWNAQLEKGPNYIMRPVIAGITS